MSASAFCFLMHIRQWDIFDARKRTTFPQRHHHARKTAGQNPTVFMHRTITLRVFSTKYSSFHIKYFYILYNFLFSATASSFLYFSTRLKLIRHPFKIISLSSSVSSPIFNSNSFIPSFTTYAFMVVALFLIASTTPGTNT